VNINFSLRKEINGMHEQYSKVLDIIYLCFLGHANRALKALDKDAKEGKYYHRR